MTLGSGSGLRLFGISCVARTDSLASSSYVLPVIVYK